MTSVSDNSTLKGIIGETIFSAVKRGPEPPKKEPDDYRYYHCRPDWDGLKCKKVDGPNVLSSEEGSKLFFVKSYIPERLDGQILKYKWIPYRVIIEDKST